VKYVGGGVLLRGCGFINGKIISGIFWYHMHLEESRILHAFNNW